MVFRSQKLRIVTNSRFSASLLVCAVCLVLCVLANQSSKNADAKSSVPPNTAIQATPTPTPPPYLFTIRVQEVAYLTGVYPQLANSSWSHTKTENGETWNWSGTTTGNSITLNTSATSSTSTIRRVGAGAFHIVEIFSLANQPAQISVSGSASLNINVASVLPWHNRSSALYFPQGFLTGEQNYQIELQGVGSLTGGSSFAAGPNTYNPTGDAYFPEYPGLTYHKIFSGAVGSGLGTTSGYTGSISAFGSTTITLPVTNQPPIAVIDGPKYNNQNSSTFYTGDRVTLSSLSYDPDNSPNATPLPGIGINAYQWTVTPPAVNGQPAPTPILFNTQNIEFVCSNAGTYNVQLVVTDDEGTQSTPAIKSIMVKAPSVTSVAFIKKDSDLDENPNTGGGKRIFPDKEDPEDDINKKVVIVRANVDARDGTPVNFKSFDVDDPSSNISPLDGNDAPVESGGDNRGDVDGQLEGELSASSAIVQNGQAEVELTVTMQPGDNFSVAASLNSYYLDHCVAEGSTSTGSGIKDMEGSQLPSATAKVTEMLTVWRRVHIEVDSMGLVTGNYVSGTIKNAHKIKCPDNGLRNCLSISTDNPISDSNRFQLESNGQGKGSINIDGGRWYVPSWIETKNNGQPGDIIAELDIPQQQVNDLKGKAFFLYDDDDFNNNDGANKKGDENENVSPPDLSLVQDSDHASNNVFAPAYVRPTYDIGNNDDYVHFVLNTPSTFTDTFDPDSVTINGSNDFWTKYLLGAYQYTIDEDGDSETSPRTPGIAKKPGLGATIFVELLRRPEAAITNLANNAATTAHELGHTFGGEHVDGGLMEQSLYRQSLQFSEKTLNRIRCFGLNVLKP